MAPRTGSSTLSESMLTQLRKDILQDHFSPGTCLISSQLSERYNVSIVVVKEALIKLAEQGLVKQNPDNEFTVKTISAPELLQINEARFINESAALRLAMIHGDHSWESQIAALHDQLSQTPEYVDTEHTIINESWSSLHNQFHRALLSGCNNTFLLDFCLRLWELSELNRDSSIQRNPDRNIAAEHQSLMGAVLARDIDQALKQYQEHML